MQAFCIRLAVVYYINVGLIDRFYVADPWINSNWDCPVDTWIQFLVTALDMKKHNNSKTWKFYIFPWKAFQNSLNTLVSYLPVWVKHVEVNGTHLSSLDPIFAGTMFNIPITSVLNKENA